MATPTLVKVSTFKDFSSPPEQVKVINYASSGARTWLAKHSYWALHNGRSVLTTPVEA